MIPESIALKIASLQEAIHTVHPTMPILLKEIHTILKNDPDVVTLLGEEEIAIIVAGLVRQTKTEITQAALKKKPVAAKISVDDL